MCCNSTVSVRPFIPPVLQTYSAAKNRAFFQASVNAQSMIYLIHLSTSFSFWGQNGVKLANSTYFQTIKKAPRKPREALNLLLAERVGFEPTVPCGTLDFE